MSGRRRRFEASWDDKEGKRPSAEIRSNVSPGRSHKWSKSEMHDDLMHSNFSRSPSWDHLQGNRNGPKDNDSRRDRNRMYSHQTFDGWEKQCNTHPSDDSYGLPYRSRDKGRMNREPERERTRSPNGSRSRSRDGMSRGSWESTRDHRNETNASYSNKRSKDFASRGGGNDITENWNRRTDYKEGSSYNDHPQRNVRDGYRSTRIPCRYFAAGNCNRDHCKFSHDVHEAAGGYDGNRNLGNKNRTWRSDQLPHDDLNAKSKLADMEKKYGSVSNNKNNTSWDSWDYKKDSLDGHASRDASGVRDAGKSHPNLDNKKMSWNGPTWDDVKSGCFDETSYQGHTSNEHNTWDSGDDKKKSLDGHASRDASGVHDTGKSHRNLDNKKISWNGPTSWDDGKSGCFDETSYQGHTSNEDNNNTRGSWDDKKTSVDGHASRDASGVHDAGKYRRNLDSKKSSWNGPTSWDDVKPGGFDETSYQGHTSNENNNNTWDSLDDKKNSLDGHASQDVSGVHDAGKALRNLDNKRSSWNGPTSWDDASGSVFSRVSIPCHKFEESAKESLIDSNAKDRMSAKSGSNMDRNNISKWGGPLWDEMSEPVMTDDNLIRKWEGGLNKMASDNVEIAVNASDLNNIVPEDAKQQVLTSRKDMMQSGHDMNTQSLSYINGSEQSHKLLSNPFNGPLNGQIHGMDVHMENQNEGGKPPKPLEMEAQQPQSLNETSLTSQLAPQANLYTELHLTDAINYLKSLPSSAYNQETGSKEEQNPVRNLEVNISAPVGILSGSVTHQNQMPADLTPSQLGGVGVTVKEAIEGTDKRVAENCKKQEQNTNRDNSEAQWKVEEGDIGNDEKAMRQFKVGLVEFVKEILKPKWKEGKMSRDVHKNVVKKVVEKVTSSIQGTQIPRTQPKIEQYLMHSKPKITKLVEAYVERLLKA